ncbi:hypothetical protein MIDIC_50061 [Alphaproteobacteria bacterium]
MMTSIPGICLIAATTAICELPQLGSTHLRQLASLAGVAPYEAVAR